MHLLSRLVDHLRSGDSYGLVLSLLLAALFAGIASPEETWARVLRDCIFAGTALVAYWTATSWGEFLVPRVVIPGMALALVAVAVAEGAGTGVGGAVIGAALTASVAFLIGRDLFHRRRVDIQTVCGALSLYILTGFLFASMFGLAAEAGDGAFFTRGDDGTAGDRLYFSMITLTTTGYGDLAPAGGSGRGFAVLEVVVGSLYLVTVVTVLVTAVTRRESRDG